jgi:hypothetical protein
LERNSLFSFDEENTRWVTTCDTSWPTSSLLAYKILEKPSLKLVSRMNVPGDGLFEEERDELIEFAEDGNEAQKRRVIDMLRAAREIVAVQVLFGNGDTGWTLDRLSPLWTWLQSNRRGLIQADGEGYYDGHDLILPLE